MNINIQTIDDLTGIAEELDWTAHLHYSEGQLSIEFEKYSPAGEDFIFSVQASTPSADVPVETLEQVCDEVAAYSAHFDTEEHIKMLLDAKAGGFAGVPCTKELVEDADAIQQMLRELAEALVYGWLGEKRTYEVTIERTGVAFVRAVSVETAMNIADRLTTDEISWSDDWSPTDATEAEDYDGTPYTEPSF